MTSGFAPGDDLVFQLESGFGLLRVIAVEAGTAGTVWHLLAYEELFPDVEAAEAALASGDTRRLGLRAAHLPLTDYAFAKTPAARLGNRPVTSDEMIPYLAWRERGGQTFDRPALTLLGLR